MSWMEIDDRPPGSYMPCTNCKGKKVDPKKRTRKCPVCNGSGMGRDRCGKCNRRVYRASDMVPKEEGVEYCDCYMVPVPPGEAYKLAGVPGERNK